MGNKDRDFSRCGEFKSHCLGLERCSVVKNICCFCIAPTWWLKLSIIPIPGEQTSKGTSHTCSTHKHMQPKHSYIYNECLKTRVETKQNKNKRLSCTKPAPQPSAPFLHVGVPLHRVVYSEWLHFHDSPECVAIVLFLTGAEAISVPGSSGSSDSSLVFPVQ